MQAHTGNIGGSSSHEYHVISPLGEDTIYACQRWYMWPSSSMIHVCLLLVCCRCGCGTNSELTNEMPASLQQCPQNSNACPLEKKRAIEVSTTCCDTYHRTAEILLVFLRGYTMQLCCTQKLQATNRPVCRLNIVVCNKRHHAFDVSWQQSCVK